MKEYKRELLDDKFINVKQELDTGGIWFYHKLNDTNIFITKEDFEIIKSKYTPSETI